MFLGLFALERRNGVTERGGMTSSKGLPSAGFELEPAAAKTVASPYRVPAQPMGNFFILKHLTNPCYILTVLKSKCHFTC